MDRYQFTEREQAVLEALPQPFVIYQLIDKRVTTLVLSDGFCELFGYEDRAEAYDYMNRDMFKAVHPDDTARAAEEILRFLASGGMFDCVYRTKTKKDTGYRVIHAIGRKVTTETGIRLAHIWYADEGLYTDERDPRKAELNQTLSNALHEQSLLQVNYYDYLTGLPSMTYFFELAEAGKETMRRAGEQMALLFFDLNGMKYFNTKQGFSEGDKLLRAFAGLLVRTFSKENCCHVSADHFAVFTKEEGVEETLRRLFLECREINGGNTLPVRVGIYRNRLEDVHISEACDRAKSACDALRNTYASCFHYYDTRLRDDAERRQYILSTLDRAIEERWIQVYYQPIVRSVNGRVCDEEALARWIDPVKGFLSPAEFIPYLEDAGLIYKLDLCVLDQVLEKIGIMKDAGLHIVPHSINLSRSDFDACDMVEEIRRRVDAAGVGRDKITIEITESVIGRDFDFMKEQVTRFQKLGFPVWMDDFGSGYSSLDVLQSIRFDLLKFDMSFMQKLDEGVSGKIILTELMRMATALGVDTVCEGVETEAQVRFLQEIGCSKLQGYYFAKPMTLSEILKRYETGTAIGFENPAESEYYETVGRVNLYDLDVIAKDDEGMSRNLFNMLPMGIMEVGDESARQPGLPGFYAALF